MSISSSSTRSDPGSDTSLSAQTRSKAMSGHLDGLLGRLVLEIRQGAEARLYAAHEPVPQLRDADVLDDVGEEAADDQPAGGLGVDTARAEVEQELGGEHDGGHR